MTTIDKLGITGIRSYSPDDETIIRFSRPLTIILGQNGSGKSSVIEAVKMATTGDLPPLVAQGAAFIHDPRIQSRPETHAKIRLQFTNVRGEEYLVSRHFLLRMARSGKQEFKTIDQTLKRCSKREAELNSGRIQQSSTSHRCAELNALLPDIMRVTKPILNNVIFVHQEDSLWPLGDPKKLKERFDDIFAATRYTKALESIRKFRKEQSAEIRVVTMELLRHEDSAKVCEKLRAEAAEIREHEVKLRNGVEMIEAELRFIEHDLAKAQKLLTQHSDCQNRLTAFETRISVLERDRIRKYQDLKEDLLEVSESALNELIDGLDDDIRRSESERRDRSIQISATRSELDGKADVFNSNQAALGVLKAEAAQQNDRLIHLSKMREEFASSLFSRIKFLRYPFEQAPSVDSPNALWTECLKNLHAKSQEEVRKVAKDRQAAEDAAASSVKDLQVRLSTNEITIKQTKSLASQKRSAAAQRREELRLVESSQQMIADAMAEEDSLKLALDNIRSADKTSQTSKQYDEAKSKYANLRTVAADRKQERYELSQDYDSRIALQNRREDLRAKQTELNFLTEDCLDRVTSICDELVVERNGIQDRLASVSADEIQQAQQAAITAMMNRILSRRDRVLSEADTSFRKASEIVTEANARRGELQKSLTVQQSSLENAEKSLSQLKERFCSTEGEGSGGHGPFAGLISAVESGVGVTVTSENGSAIAKAIERAEYDLKKATQAVHLMKFSKLYAQQNLERFNNDRDETTGKYVCPTCRVTTSKPSIIETQRHAMVEELKRVSDPQFENTVKADFAKSETRLQALKDLSTIGSRIVELRQVCHNAASTVNIANENMSNFQKNLDIASSNRNKVLQQFGEASDVSRAERICEEIGRKAIERDRLRSELNSALAFLPENAGNRTVSQVDNEIQELEETMRIAQDDMDRARRANDLAKEDVSRAENRFRTAKDKRLALEQNIEKRRFLEAERDDLYREAKRLEDEAAANEEEIAALEGDLRIAMAEFVAVREESARVLESWKSDVARIEKAQADWTAVVASVEAFLSLGKDKELSQLERQMEKMKDEIDRLQTDLRLLTEEAEHASDVLREKEAQVRNARENKAYRSLNAELQLYQSQARDVRRDMDRLCGEAGGIAAAAAAGAEARREMGNAAADAARMAGVLESDAQLGNSISSVGGMLAKQHFQIKPEVLLSGLMQQRSERNAWRHATEGKAQAYTERWSMKKADIKEADRKGSMKKYEECRIKKQTMELASADLDRYHRALDQALMSFHTLKMDTINKTIKDLWQSTYRGNDIDEIEIVSDASDAAGSSGGGIVEKSSASVRRNYNYRVMMRRGDAKLDMRGRCSAGQKVLACLVIRLALAESFCTDCGILALDEPTTNLDRDNVQSLAYALRAIIENRRRQKNFQLILISHDQDFLALLSARAFCDQYYLVYKDADGNSAAKMQDIRALED